MIVTEYPSAKLRGTRAAINYYAGFRTTTVEKSLEEIKLTPKVRKILKSVQAHDSKASATYYYKNLKNYFMKMEMSFQELARVLKKEGSLHIVLQDSKL